MTVVVIMRRQETTRSSSSSSRRDNRVPIATPDQNHRVNAVGCMAGIFHFVSNYQNRRKFLTFGRKQEKQGVLSPPAKKTKRKIESSPPAPAPPPPPPNRLNPTTHSDTRKNDNNNRPSDPRNLSIQVHRSPTIPAEIRRSKSTLLPPPPPQIRSPRTLMERLMGLDEVPSPPTTKLEESEAAEKRRRLLGALEKCDEDLKSLKKIIESVRSDHHHHHHRILPPPSPPRTPPPRVVRKTETERVRKTETERVRKLTAENGGEQQPSPVSVLDAFAAASPTSSSGESPPKNRNGMLSKRQQLLQHHQTRKKPTQADILISHFLNRSATSKQPAFHGSTTKRPCSAPRSTRISMIETVEEVCRDVAWGHSREVVKVAQWIQDYIYKDLVDEAVNELGLNDMYYSPSLPFVSCKKRLSF